MLRVSEFKKSPNSLGDPVGREVCVKYDDRKKLTPVYVKYGRDLAKVTNLSKDWNVTVFDSSLNQAVLPWMVIPGSSDKRIVFNTNEKGLKLFSDKDSSGTLVDGGASTKTEDLNQPDSAVHLISANGKVCAMTLDDNHLVQNFKLLNGKLEEQDYPEVTVMEGKIIPVIKSSGDTEYLAHCSEKKLTLYNLIKSGSGKSERSIKMNAICQKLFYTENKQVLLISNEGLHVLSLADDKISPSYYCSHFSKDEGWTKNFYDTIQLVKVGTEEVLISTGPNGIQAVKISNECKVYTIQDDPDKIKHVAIGNAVGKGPNQIEVTGYYNTELYSFTLTFAESQVIPEPTVEEPQQPPQPTAPKPDSKFKLSNNFAKPTRWLVDTLDESHFRNTVNKLTGRVELAFPLVDLQDRFGVPIKLMAYYREGLGGEQTGVLGRHWTLGRDCIVLDDKGSVFGEMHEYFLVKDQVRIRLVKREISTGKKFEPTTEQKKKIAIMERMMKIPLDFERYTLQINSDGVIYGNQLIYHDGSTFKTSPLDEKSLKLEQFQLPVGDSSVLKKESVTDNLKFCTKFEKEDCSNLETSSARNVSIKYPHYFISQNKETTWVHVLKPNGKGVQEKVSFPKEMVHRSSSHSTFVATKLADNSTHVRPFRSISNNKAIQVEVVSKESLKSVNGEQSISYEYQDPVLRDSQVMFKTTLVIPGSNKKAFGFYQESVDFITNEQVVQVMDSKGDLFDPEYVKRMNEVQEEQRKQRDEPEADGKQMILDKSGTLPILSTKPYVKDDRAMISFFSFEDYESGEGEKPVKGIIKLQINDWIYIEADTSSLKRPLSPKIDLTAKIAATEADLHVDHVRLTPLNFNFEARVYDSRTSQRVVTIHNNGRVTRFVHDDYSRRIAEIDELGGIKYFATYAIEEGSNSRLQMRPKVGFVESFSPYTAGGRWKTMKEHKVEPGKIRLNGYPYSQIVYHPNPLEIRHKVAQPGELYSIKKGSFLHTFDISSSVSFINSNYPTAEGFRCEEERKPNGMTQVTVYNRRNKKVAEYIAVRDYKNALTTYLYDEFGNEIQKLPPKFYETSRTGKMSPEKVKRDTAWATNSEYNKEGSLLMKRSTPDGGLVEFIYDDYNQLRYQLHYNEAKQVDKIVYFRYNLHGQVYETGWLNATAGLADELRKDVNADLPERSHVLYFDYGETDSDPAMRGRTQRVIKQNGDLQFKQVLFYDEDGNVLRKSFLSQNANETLSLDYLWKNDQITGIRYPFFVKGKQLVLRYEHNLRGEVTSISLINDKSETPIVKLGHDAQGKVTEISHQYGMNKFNQSYEYEAPGYLKIIKNPYLTETLYYTEKGYGAEPVGDGSILRTEFHAMWHNQCDQNLIPLTARAFISDKLNAKMAELCFDALLERGYFDGQGRPLKSYYPDLEVDIPIKCSTGSAWEGIATGILERGYPEHYGHAYDYGSHSELVAAKYFVGEERDNLELPWKAKSFEDQLKKELSGAGGTINLTQNLAATLGNSPADVESFSIDSNGNHGTYYTGFKRFELIYKSTNNQIATIKKGSKPYDIAHDSEGNIIKAAHKDIDKLKYDPLTQRVSKIEMTSKKLIIEFGYDHLGERVVKRVRNTSGDVLSELYYVRDSNGNTLVEYKLTYPNPKETSKPIVTVTAYIHGPLGLVGFFRNDKYYSVLLDHEGSTRLVIHQNRVVAAYDYMPYGQLMRKFGSSAEAHIAYRYTGQEYDEETGLYNYHARLYDPDIGRFYQLDPMEQYPSPYKYAGNSPVSQIDPDGQVAITLIVIGIGALLGAYFGAASANNSWNPAEWDWANKRTWIGLFAGALAGGFAAYGGLASFAYLTSLFGGSLTAAGVVTGTLAAGGAFLGAAAATNEWDPHKWDWTSPIVWNGLLTGTAVAVSLPSGFVGISRTFYSLVSNAAKILYGSAMISGFLLLGYVGGALANNFNFRMDQWDWKNPRTWFGIIEGSATVIMATGGTVKHGAFKTHFITSPGKLKGAWYRINIPAKSFTVKETPWKFFITYYKNGQKVGSQIIDITTRKGLRSIPQVWQGTTKYFFISNGRIAAGMVAMGSYTFAKYHNYRSLFEQYPNETQKIGSFLADTFGQDSFKSCFPITWQGYPSVSCDGQESTFVYTPRPQLRVFDMVDGWLLLARVAPAVLRSFKNGFSFVKSVFSGDVKAFGERNLTLGEEVDG
ncbi:conserved hypothetical protein [Culex quinquefasciatus]|uniref:Tox-SGS domain-containing protein n=1 Tax=Culex quinquefasciatus TaxID=7176 RepID=B0WKJ0_CULQU|nr:conserved hypothetical protein [Culex quinquefasciatus]|eukprot:XP_001849224.1 conserved hypothetical protein [Culex quinquefasciatus]